MAYELTLTIHGEVPTEVAGDELRQLLWDGVKVSLPELLASCDEPPEAFRVAAL